jgi:hypothetical protein
MLMDTTNIMDRSMKMGNTMESEDFVWSLAKFMRVLSKKAANMGGDEKSNSIITTLEAGSWARRWTRQVSNGAVATTARILIRTC